MSLSPEVLDAIRTVALRLGALREEVVFVGGAVRGLLITDPAVEGSRATKDIDVIAAGITTRLEYYTVVHERLRVLGFREDSRDGAPLCRWRLGELIVDVMPPISEVLGFSNRWYLHAAETAVRCALPGTDHDPVTIRLVTAPAFVATKLEAFQGRGDADYAGSHDLEDIIAVADGRPSLVREVEGEPAELRQYLAEQLSNHLSGGLEDALSGHLAGDSMSQARLPRVLCALNRIRRYPRILAVGQAVQSKAGGQPGANGPPVLGPWRIEILGVERREVGPARAHFFVSARVTNLARIAGTIGDGRNMHIEDVRGVRFRPLYELVVREAKARGLAAPQDRAGSDEPFETCWGYEVPREAQSLRLLLPFDGFELPLPD